VLIQMHVVQPMDFVDTKPRGVLLVARAAIATITTVFFVEEMR